MNTTTSQNITRQLIVKCNTQEDFEKCQNDYLKNFSIVGCCNCGCLILLECPVGKDFEEFKLEINTGTVGTQKKVEVDGNEIIKIIDKNEGNTESWSMVEKFPADTYDNEVIIYFIDTGMDKEYWDKSQFKYEGMKLPEGVDEESYGYNFIDPSKITGDFGDDNGHGTFGVRHVTEHLPESAKIKIKIVPLKAFDEQGETTLFSFISALHYAIENGANIINISAGYSGKSNKILEDVIKQCNEKGIFIVTAAGNGEKNLDTEEKQYPAFYGSGKILNKKTSESNTAQQKNQLVSTEIISDNVISVAALDHKNILLSDSNYGKESVTMAAYGKNINGYDHKGEVVYSGTSVAAFAVTKALAIKMAKKSERDYKEVWEYFKASSLVDFIGGAEQTITGKRLNVKLKKYIKVEVSQEAPIVA